MTEEQYRVLILDDDYELGIMLQEYLQNTRVCVVTYVTTIDDLWDCLAHNTYDILFLDYRLPEGNGIDVLERMSEQGITTPTVMMTGEGNENIAAKAIQSGALDYLVKGQYSFSALLPLVHKAVRLREMQQAMQQYLGQVRYQSMLLDNMRDAVVVWGLDGGITYWNTAAEQLYGSHAADRLGKSVYAVYFPNFDPPINLPDLNRAGNFQIEHRYILPPGEKIWISAHITTLYNEGSSGEPIGYMNVARDVTPRRLEQEALVKSQLFVQRILDTSPNIIYIVDLRAGRMRYMNPEVRTILGYPVEEFVYEPLEHFTGHIHPDDRGQMAQHLHDLETMMDGEVREIEYRFRSGAGDWRWLKTRETAFSRVEEGVLAEVIGVIQDITANKLAESKLHHRLTSEKLLSNISNTFINLSGPEIDGGISAALELVSGFLGTDSGIIFLVEEDQLAAPYVARFSVRFSAGLPENAPVLDINQAHAPWILDTVQRHEMIVLNRLEDLPPGADPDRETLAQVGLRSLVLLPMVYNNNLIGLLSFNTTRQEMDWSEDDIYVIKTFAEMITSALVQKQVDQALRKSEARYRAIVEEHQTEMICRFLPDATLTFVNEAYCKFYGLSRGELVGASFLDPVLPDERPDVRETLATICTDLPVATHEQRVRLPDGNVRWQEWTSRAIFDQHNDFIEFQSVGRDITLKKRMEEQIKAAQTRLTQAARLASIGELAAGVAHQISNPLTTIIADAQILSQQLDREHPGRESAEAIVQAGWRAQQVISELMKFSQPSHATHELVSINDTIDKALLLAGAHIQASGVQLEVDLAPGLPQINGNPRQLTDLWVNLLLLARNAFSNGGEHTIRIRSHQNGSGAISVEVTDNGIPIPAIDYDHIFEPRLTPTGEGRGTGLELSICREIARQNRGQIAISGGEHETTIQITFTGEG